MVAVVRPRVQVRAMRPEDVSTIAIIEAGSYEFPWTPGIFNDCLKAGYSCWVLWADGVMAGYGVLSSAAGEAHVLNVCISAAYRGQGLGRLLMRRLLDVARWNGAARVLLEVRLSNLVAKQLYESLGFGEIGRRPRYYPARQGREDAIVMALDFSAQK